VRKDTVSVGLFCKRDLFIWLAYKSLSPYGRNCRGNYSRQINVCVSVFCACVCLCLVGGVRGEIDVAQPTNKARMYIMAFHPRKL